MKKSDFKIGMSVVSTLSNRKGSVTNLAVTDSLRLSGGTHSRVMVQFEDYLQPIPYPIDFLEIIEDIVTAVENTKETVGILKKVFRFIRGLFSTKE